MEPLAPRTFADAPPPSVPAVGGSEVSGGPDTLPALLRAVVVAPAAAMRRLAARPGRWWVVPIAALALATTAATAAGLPAGQRFSTQLALAQARQMAERQPQMMGDQSPEDVAAFTSGGAFAAIGAGTALLGALLGGAIGIAVAAAALHLLGTVLGGQQTYTQMLTVVSWAHLPFVPRELLRLVYHIMGGFDPSPQGLSGLVAPDPFVRGAQASYLTPLLAQIEVWNLWYWALLVIGVAIVAHVSRRKALVGVIVLVLCQIVLGLGGVAASRSLAGMFGG